MPYSTTTTYRTAPATMPCGIAPHALQHHAHKSHASGSHSATPNCPGGAPTRPALLQY
ncbi:MAG: hypothetical protein IJV22_04795 [Bacteroidales bacterium]|nr:hypothetical protein [Bacteroidales bacterium]